MICFFKKVKSKEYEQQSIKGNFSLISECIFSWYHVYFDILTDSEIQLRLFEIKLPTIPSTINAFRCMYKNDSF